MAALLYIHGFLSSPLSSKAQQTHAWLAEKHPEIKYFCPQLTPYPADVQKELSQLMQSLLAEPVYVIGSSLGGFWATWLVEKYNVRAVLINPAVKPQIFMQTLLDIDLKSYHSDEVFRLQSHHVEEIRATDLPITRLNNYWLLVQTGDEVIDYTIAVKAYAGCKQTVEQGGDHSFQGFENYLEDIFTFLNE